jgi:hypothetical protein
MPELFDRKFDERYILTIHPLLRVPTTVLSQYRDISKFRMTRKIFRGVWAQFAFSVNLTRKGLLVVEGGYFWTLELHHKVV